MHKHLTSIVSGFIFLFISTSTLAQATDKGISIIPRPSHMKTGNGNYHINGNSKIEINTKDKEWNNLALFFNNKIQNATGFILPAVTENGDIRIKKTDDTTLGNEGYTLTTDNTGVTITAYRPAGAFYGLQTLLQLLPSEIKSKQPVEKTEWTVPYVSITDKPQFAWRGLMLDVSRHWFTKEEVKQFIDELAEYKMNVFHWHLTDDQGWRIEIKSLPRLTEIGAWRAPRVGQWWKRDKQQPGEKATYGGFYTQDDIREVLAYAAERHVRVIPEIDVPGHSLAALVAYPELACMKAPKSVNVGNKFYGIDENSLCAGKTATYEFMEKVLTEVAGLFPDEYIHIGGDECFKGFWSKCPDCQALMKKEKLKNTEELQSFFIRRMEKILKSKGKKLIGWDEIHEGGLAPEATVMSWRGMQGGIKAAQAGHHVIMTPSEHCYIDLYQGEKSVEPDTYSMCRLSDSYNLSLVPEGINPEMILGGQGNLWAESVPHFRHAEYMTWPRGWALSEVFWSGDKNKNWDDFIKRVEAHFVRADRADINYARSMYNAIITPYKENDTMYIDITTEITDLEIYYTFDNTTPDRFSPRYTAPLTIPKDATWLQVVTCRDGKPVGAVITLETEALRKQSSRNKHPVGNLNL